MSQDTNGKMLVTATVGVGRMGESDAGVWIIWYLFILQA